MTDNVVKPFRGCEKCGQMARIIHKECPCCHAVFCEECGRAWKDDGLDAGGGADE